MPTKDHRRELRLSSSDDDLIDEAAGLMRLTVSEFLLGRAVADAEAIVDAHRSVRLQQDSYDRCHGCSRLPTDASRAAADTHT